MQIQSWDDLLTDPGMVLAFPDLASMDMPASSSVLLWK